jgi:hypothetical protein
MKVVLRALSLRIRGKQSLLLAMPVYFVNKPSIIGRGAAAAAAYRFLSKHFAPPEIRSCIFIL